MLENHSNTVIIIHIPMIISRKNNIQTKSERIIYIV